MFAMKLRSFFSLALVALLLLTPHPTRAFVSLTTSGGAILHWDFDEPAFGVGESIFNSQTRAIRFHLASDAFSESHREAELNVLREAFGQWNAVPNSFLKFEEGALISPEVDINTGDGTNIVKWTKTTTLVNGERTDIGGRLGLAFTSFFADGKMAAADIIINGVHHDWHVGVENATDSTSSIDAVALHEIGHAVGAEHTPAGGAAMFARGNAPAGFETGLSVGEISFAQTIYGTETALANLGTVEGRITGDGIGILGAAVFLETSDGTLKGSTVSLEESDSDPLGHYQLRGIPPGSYQLRVAPLDPQNPTAWLATGRDISFRRFDQAEVNFLPTEPTPIQVTAGTVTTRNLEVDLTSPAFRIDRIRGRTDNPRGIRWVTSPIVLEQGVEEIPIGVFGPYLPTTGVELLVTGDGLTLGPTETTTQFFNNLPHVFRMASVAADATPGLRSFIIRSGNDVAYANGFLEIRAAEPDLNFDGLADSFQRTHFRPFTAPEAAPDADPDNDGATNQEEEAAGTNPTVPDGGGSPNPSETLTILRVALTASGAQVEIESNAGTRYQLYKRDQVAIGSWIPEGNPVTGTGGLLILNDPTATTDIRFYEVRTVN